MRITTENKEKREEETVEREYEETNYKEKE
jgi:hypothetical protein